MILISLNFKVRFLFVETSQVLGGWSLIDAGSVEEAAARHGKGGTLEVFNFDWHVANSLGLFQGVRGKLQPQQIPIQIHANVRRKSPVPRGYFGSRKTQPPEERRFATAFRDAAHLEAAAMHVEGDGGGHDLVNPVDMGNIPVGFCCCNHLKSDVSISNM